MSLPGLVMGGGEIFLLALVLLLIFGASRTSKIGQKLQEMVTNFRRSLQKGSGEEDPPPDQAT